MHDPASVPRKYVMSLPLTQHPTSVTVQLTSGKSDYLRDTNFMVPLQILVTTQSCGLTLRTCRLLQHGML